jgi:hypothetical protein
MKKKVASISDVSKPHLSARNLYDALAVIPVFRLQHARAAESLGFTVGPELLIFCVEAPIVVPMTSYFCDNSGKENI